MLWVNRKDLFIVTLIAAVSGVIAAIYYTGLYCSDDTRYLIGAIRIAIGDEISIESLAERRAAFLLPASIAYGLTQSFDLSIGVYSLFHVGLVVFLYVLAREFFDAWAAFCVALIGLAQPTIFLYSGALLPDITTSFFLALAMLFLLKLVLLISSDVDEGKTGFMFGIACGGSAAVAFTLKESSLVVLPIIAAALGVGLLKRGFSTGWSSSIAVAAGFGGAIFIETLLFKVVAGQWYSSLNSLFHPHDFEGFTDIQGVTLVARLGSLYGQLGHYTAVLFLLAAASLCKIVDEWRAGTLRGANLGAWLIVAAFWAWPTFYFTFGTSSLTEYALPVMQQRYYAPCIVPAALLAGRLLAPLAVAPSPVFWRAFSVVTFAVLLTAPFTKAPERGLIYGAPAKEAFALAIHDLRREYPDVQIVDTDSGWTTDLNRCRLLLLSDSKSGHQRLVAAINDRRDLDAKFEYSEIRDLRPPFILVGHGEVLDESKEWVKNLNRRVKSGEVQVEFLGQYDALPHSVVQAHGLLPRNLVISQYLEDKESDGLGLILDGPEKNPSRNSVGAYIVSNNRTESVEREVR